MHTTSLAFTIALAVGLMGCGKDANTQICLDELKLFEASIVAKDEKAKELAGGLYQTCGISCDITKDSDACAAFKRVTEVICEKEGKETCQKLCGSGEAGSEKNVHACAAVAAMK